MQMTDCSKSTRRNRQKHTIERQGAAEVQFPPVPVVPYRVGLVHLVPRSTPVVEPGLDSYELIWCLSGSLAIPIRQLNATRTLQPGDVLFRSPGTPRTGYCKADTPAEYRYICFHGRCAREFFSAYGIPENTPFPAGKCPDSLFDELELLILLNTPYALRRCVAVIADIFAEMLPGKDASEGSQLLDRALSRILTLYHSPTLNVQSLANALSVHRTTLQRLFEKQLGIPPHRYLLELRLRKAKMLIEDSSLPLAEIASSTGFARYNYFCSCFTRHVGCTPGELRRNRSAAKSEKNTPIA